MKSEIVRTTKEFDKPYKHYVITNFLPEEDFSKICKIYNSLSFYFKQIDLFKFNQTNELNQNSDLQFFQNHLKNISKDLNIEATETIDMFASLYNKGDYLLCHDDMLSTRNYAYSFYLEDYEYGGELVMFNSTCDRKEKAISVRRNTLVLFEVSNISWHEVNYCEKDGRKAFTGWLHKKEENNSETKISRLKNLKYGNSLNGIKKIKLDITSFEDIIYFGDIHFDINSTICKEVGPFCNRRLELIQGSNVIFKIKDMKLVKKQSFHVRKGDYLLLTDEFNDDKTYKSYFVFKFCNLEKTAIPLIKFVNNNGEIEFELDTMSDCVYFINATKWKWFIERSEHECLMEVFLYEIN
ncbi:hypothetical protein EDEG_01676 [Edhazardia aedis USNM 41457]|uniref:Prolyl 4-hydroxylase alpha subunit domain-containing protein n=1 Tax=Edhazardia aedis (strain USNM 41457) TaxID=1003232 RepID=J9DRX0_EDHAE|nr:hypothetical protein EDEG_01676 [Edhazardia aedis USNM 41457]|eukprot:EJW04042.1 hypothetical protein EDEG_01676 [Edhazardia aedis USNM 41457]